MCAVTHRSVARAGTGPPVSPLHACSHVSPSLLRCQPSVKLGLMQCRQWKPAAASVSLLGLSWWKSIRLNFNSFSVSVLVPSKGHSYLSLNSALYWKIGIQRIVLNFFHPLLLLCLCGACSQLSVLPSSHTFIKH